MSCRLHQAICLHTHIPTSVLILLLLSAMLAIGCGKSESDATDPVQPNTTPIADSNAASPGHPVIAPTTHSDNPVRTVTPFDAQLSTSIIYRGRTSLEERIVAAEVIARVKLLSVLQVVEQGVEVMDPNDFDVYKENYRDIPTKTFYIGALDLRFEVLEYLKGSGSSELVAVLGDYTAVYDNRQEAEAIIENLLDKRYRIWDEAEAIVFLYDTYNRETGWGFPSIQQPDRYELGILRGSGGQENYSINNRHGANWLPAKASEGASGAGASGSAGQQFLTGGVPVNMLHDGVSGASGASGDNSVMTLSDLKRRIAEIEEEVNAGDGSVEYRECVQHKYTAEREVRYLGGEKNPYSPIIEYIDFESGVGAEIRGREIYIDMSAGLMERLRYLNQDPEFWVEGGDADLFVAKFPGVVFPRRPLPEGEYRFFFNERLYVFIICDGQPEGQKNNRELRVNVTAPESTVHESFFDPVDISTAVGANRADGVLEPASFTYESSNATIQRLGWESGRIRMQLDPSITLTDHHIDFIALDGSVSLRLDFDDAVSVSDGNAVDALTWGVCEQPWQSGDLLMLRISHSEPGLTDTTNDADCAATPEATPTPEPILTTTTDATSTPMSDATLTPDTTPTPAP